MGANTCAGCGATLEPPRGTGRRRKWCGDRCRKKSSYGGNCVECGGPTSCSGKGAPSTRCPGCASAARRQWTHDRIVSAIQRYVEENGDIPSAKVWLHSRPGYAPSVSRVQRRFGSWNAAIRAAGFVPRPHGRPVKHGH